MNVEFQPMGRRGNFDPGETVLDYARKLGVGISSVCGGKGTCLKCKVQLVNGAAPLPTDRDAKAFSPDQLASGWRLACQTRPVQDCVVHVPVESMTTPQRAQLEGVDIPVAAMPAIKSHAVTLNAPTLSDQLGDVDRLLLALKQNGVGHRTVDIEAIREMPAKARDWSWSLQAILHDGELIGVARPASRHLGLAVDFGSTKLAGYLIDLDSGKTLASKGLMNPQISYGEDIIARCNMAASSPEGAALLQKLAADAITELAASMAESIGAKAEDVLDAVVVGNTAMDHLYLGLPVKQLATAPFVPAVTMSLDVKARDIGVRIARGAYVHVLPNIAGFVGADHVSMLLATDADKLTGPTVALDIGTNTEISLINEGRITSVSCASGPAFEGGHIKDGMRAGTGAIERLRITPDGVEYETIDDAPCVGICGSGIIDAVAQLYLAGIIDASGRMDQASPRVRTVEGVSEFVLACGDKGSGPADVVFTQHDVRELQLGKAAIRAGIATLLDASGITEDQIKQIVIAGAFGSYLDLNSALDIGMFPAIPLERFKQVGNAAGMGAKRALISLSQREEAKRIAAKAEYMELAGNAAFNRNFIKAMQLGRYRLRDGNREEED